MQTPPATAPLDIVNGTLVPQSATKQAVIAPSDIPLSDETRTKFEVLKQMFSSEPHITPEMLHGMAKTYGWDPKILEMLYSNWKGENGKQAGGNGAGLRTGANGDTFIVSRGPAEIRPEVKSAVRADVTPNGLLSGMPTAMPNAHTGLPPGISNDATTAGVGPSARGPAAMLLQNQLRGMDGHPAIAQPALTGQPARPLSLPIPANHRPDVSGGNLQAVPVHEVKRFPTDPMMQQAYEIFCAPPWLKTMHWMTCVFKKTDDTWSMIQKDIFAEYRAVFDGSPNGIYSGGELLSILPSTLEARTGKSASNPSEFRIWGLLRLKLFPGSPWDLLYSGKLRHAMNEGVKIKEIFQVRPDRGVQRLGGPPMVQRLNKKIMQEFSKKENDAQEAVLKVQWQWMKKLPTHKVGPIA